MNYVEAFFGILNGSYQTNGRNVGRLYANKVRHIHDIRVDHGIQSVQVTTIEVRVRNTERNLVAVGDLAGKIFMKWNNPNMMFPGATYSTCSSFFNILERDYRETGMVEYQGQQWFSYQYKKSPLVDLYGFRVANSGSFKDYLITKYGERR